jgi:hypothetical protein
LLKKNKKLFQKRVKLPEKLPIILVKTKQKQPWKGLRDKLHNKKERNGSKEAGPVHGGLNNGSTTQYHSDELKSSVGNHN